jgi:hypothetical protein
MTTLTDRRVIELVRGALPVPDVPTDPTAELWPSVRRRIVQRPAAPSVLDWVLAAAAGLACLLHPSLVGLLFLHF